MTWPIKKYNRGFNQYWNIQDSAGTAKNISGYTITLQIKQGNTLLVSGVVVIASATTGYAYYTVQSGDFPYSGKFDYELELVKGNEKVETETYAVHVGRTL